MNTTRDELRKLADAAMPAPWEADRDQSDWQMVVYVDVDGSGGPIVCSDRDLSQADAEFIAAVRTALPALLDQLDQAEARIKAVQDVLDAWDLQPGDTDFGDDIRRALAG